MKLKKFSSQWAWIVTQWLISSESKQSDIKIGMNNRKLDPIAFRKLCENPTNKFYLIFEKGSRQPVGLVALSDINMNSKTARTWYVLNESHVNNTGIIVEAIKQLLRIGFEEIGLESIHAWTLKNDSLSKSILTQNRFNFIGKRRQCHSIDGELHDRMLYDIISREFLEAAYEKQSKGILPYHERSSLQNLSH